MDPRKKAGETKRLQTRSQILATAEAKGEDLIGMPMATFSRAAGFSVNTVKRQFSSIDDIIVAVVDKMQRAGQSIPSRLAVAANEHRMGRTLHSAPRHELARKLKKYAGLEISDQIDKLMELYTNSQDDHAARELASICCHLSYAYLVRSSSGGSEDAKHAQNIASEGLRHVGRVEGRTPLALAAQLARIAAASAHQQSRHMFESLGAHPSKLEVSEARGEELVRLRSISDFKGLEATYLDRLDQPVLAAAARYQQNRADAFFHGSSEAESNATSEFAQTLTRLEKDGYTIPPRLLVPFLARMCCVDVAFGPGSAEGKAVSGQASSSPPKSPIRDELLSVLARREEGLAPARALKTMFALADNAGSAEGSFPFHSTDLAIVSSFGVVGNLLVADYLNKMADESSEALRPGRAARTSSSENAVELDVQSLRGAAKMYYARAATGTVFGSSGVLTNRARTSLATITEPTNDPREWPIFKTGEVNSDLLQKLALSVVTGQRPTPKQARTLLEEFSPIIAHLHRIANVHTIADVDAHSVVYGSAEPVALEELRFD